MLHHASLLPCCVVVVCWSNIIRSKRVSMRSWHLLARYLDIFKHGKEDILLTTTTISLVCLAFCIQVIFGQNNFTLFWNSSTWFCLIIITQQLNSHQKYIYSFIPSLKLSCWDVVFFVLFSSMDSTYNVYEKISRKNLCESWKRAIITLHPHRKLLGQVLFMLHVLQHTAQYLEETKKLLKLFNTGLHIFSYK